MLADKLGVPFIELDRMVEQEYGASMPLLIEMSGLATFRRHERACLERVISENETAVIATAGGIVSNPRPTACCFAAPTRSGSARSPRST